MGMDTDCWLPRRRLDLVDFINSAACNNSTFSLAAIPVLWLQVPLIGCNSAGKNVGRFVSASLWNEKVKSLWIFMRRQVSFRFALLGNFYGQRNRNTGKLFLNVFSRLRNQEMEKLLWFNCFACALLERKKRRKKV